jgi:probable rRNA maturation factor|tara:strand:+ start:27 stop:470 length:444 start_codon:yes stop_codon:yes gene_type:complete
LKIIYQGYFFSNEKNALEIAKSEFLKYFNITNNFIFFLHSVSEEESIKLNMLYFKKNLPADVLTIPLYKSTKDIYKLNKDNEEVLGDLFINRKLIKKNALKYKKTIAEELQLVLIHGLLHLVGYSHENEDKLKLIENKILNKVWKNG